MSMIQPNQLTYEQCHVVFVDVMIQPNQLSYKQCHVVFVDVNDTTKSTKL